MGELAASGRPGDVLVSIGLGSCIGLVLVDRRRSVAGLAHVMLPASRARGTHAAAAKFADLAVPLLVTELRRLGSYPSQLEAVLVGGARMFSFSDPALDIGSRNERATIDQLALARIPVAATATSGSIGRTVRVAVSGGVVTCEEAGGAPVALLGERR